METQTLVETKPQDKTQEQFNYRAIRLGDGLVLESIAKTSGFNPPQPHAFALYHQAASGEYIYILNYGVIVFCNASEEFINAKIKDWEPFILQPSLRLGDELMVHKTSGSQIEIRFESLQIGRFDDAVNKMIMLLLAQSVVLDHFSYSSQELITHIKEHTSYMQEKGRIRLSQKETLKFIGKTLSAKNHIAENLFILGSPEQTWEDEYLEVLHTKLKHHLDQGQRYRVIENSLSIVDENLSIYASYNNHRESSRLEWIIIILIVIEVIDTFVTKLW